MKKLKSSDSGITLISLIVTVIILLILAAVSISTLTGENGVITKAEEAAQKYSDAQQKEIELLDEVAGFIDYMQDKSYLELWTGKIVGEDGAVTLPISLNDCSKDYIVTVESSLYKGEVLLNVYGFTDGTYRAYSAVDGNSSTYAAELRQLFTILETDSALVDSVEGAIITYQGNDTTCTLSYDNGILNSELTITKIASVSKTYTKFAKILYNGFNECLTFAADAQNGVYDHYTEEDYMKTDFFMQFITSKDLLSSVRYCLENGISGYKYLNESLSDETLKVNENFEIQTLRNILSYRAADVETIKLSIVQQIQCIMYYNLLTTTQIYSGYGEVNDPYSIMDFWEENKYLNEAYMRLIGNTCIPFTLMFSDDLVTCLNEDGMLTDDFSDPEASGLQLNGMGFSEFAESYATKMPTTGNAGYTYRTMADYYDSVYDLVLTVDSSTLSELDKLKIDETNKFFMGPNNGNLIGSIFTAYPFGWFEAYAIYMNKEMDTMYTMMYDNNIRINLAGLRLGWYYVIQPTLFADLFSSTDEMAVLDFFDIRKDTEYLQKAGATAIADDLYAYIESVIIEQSEEDTSTDSTDTDTNTSTTSTETDTNTTETNSTSTDTNTTN